MDVRLLIIAVIFLLAGIYSLYKSIKAKAGTVGIVSGILLIALGGATLITEFLFGTDVSARVIMASVGAFMIVMAIQSFSTTKKCTTAINARYIGCEYNYKSTYCPVFEFEFEAVKYRIKASQAYSRSYIKKNFEKDPENCEIYINPDDPKMLLTNRKVGAAQIILLILGLVFLGLVAYTIINPTFFTFD